MLIIDRVIIRNFLSVGAISQTVTLNTAPLTLILGENLDVTGEESRNGAGKTTIVQAICYALYGEPLTNIKKDNLINIVNEKDMLVCVDFHRDGVPYRIERGRKPNLLRFLVGAGRDDHAQGENKQTQIAIENVLGLSHNMFLLTVALNTYSLPFLKMRTADQREVIEELFGITMISQLAAKLKEIIDQSKQEFRDEESMIKAVTEANARVNSAISIASHDALLWDQKHQLVLDDLGEQASRLLDVDVDAELAVFDQIDAWREVRRRHEENELRTRHEIETVQNRLSRCRDDLARADLEANRTETADIQGLIDQAKRLRLDAAVSIKPQISRELSQAKRLRETASERRRHGKSLQKELSDLLGHLENPDAHHCSTCQQGLAGTDHLKVVVASLKKKSQDLSQQIERALDDAERGDREAEIAEREAATLDQTHQRRCAAMLEDAVVIDAQVATKRLLLNQTRSQAADSVAALQSEIGELEKALLQSRQALEPILAALSESAPRSQWDSRDSLWELRQRREKLTAQLETEIARDNPVRGKIDALHSTLAIVNYDRLNEIDLQLKHELFVHKMLTAKDSFIRKRIIDQNLSFLNRTMNRYLQELGLPHEVRFLSDLSVEITLMGRDMDFEQLSRGEMNRVTLANSWSFRDAWENLNSNINLMFADEILDQGTDGAGVEAAVGILARMAGERQKNIFLISHRDALKSQIERVLVVQKLDKFTSFYEDGV